MDDTFLRECLSEVRDGEGVVIQSPRRQWANMIDRLVALGATEDELVRIQFEDT